MRWRMRPSSAIVLPAVVSATVRHSLFDRLPDAVQVVGEIVCVERGLRRHHSAPNIHTDSRRDNRATRRNHAANSRTNTPVHVRHRRHPLVDEWQTRHVEQLLLRRILQGHTLGPRLHRNSTLRRDHVVSLLSHCLVILSFLPPADIASAARRGTGGRSRPPVTRSGTQQEALTRCGLSTNHYLLHIPTRKL